MRRALILVGCLLGTALAACGGSSSETPWPAEPENTALGPAGESATSATSTTRVAGEVIADGGAPSAARADDRAKKPE
jgi:hypothetical protein